MLTPFGKLLRKLRIDNGLLLKNMADYLGVTSSYLSAVETGKRNIPSDWSAKISSLLNLDEPIRNELEQAILQSQKEIQINLDNLSQQQRDLAFVFARKLDSLDEDEIKKCFKSFKITDQEE